ncbi:hypothetical protein ACW5EG_05560 [Luteimonas sp. A611]
MDFKQVPLALALALAIGALGSGCAGDGQAPPADATGADSVPAAQLDTPAGDDPHAHDDPHVQHGQLGMDVPVVEGHEPWTPDAPLIEGMSRVRTAIAGLKSDPDPATVAARATDVDAAIEYMFANCELETEPDVALHAILARLMAGTQALHANPADAAPVADMHAAVGNYEALFDDPNG